VSEIRRALAAYCGERVVVTGKVYDVVPGPHGGWRVVVLSPEVLDPELGRQPIGDHINLLNARGADLELWRRCLGCQVEFDAMVVEYHQRDGPQFGLRTPGRPQVVMKAANQMDGLGREVGRGNGQKW
jgi:hypothetical protein